MSHHSEQERDAPDLRLSATGDYQAFERLVERHAAAVFRFIRAYERDAALVEDAFQESFLAAWRSAGEFRGDGSARGWLLAIARNAISRQHRKRAGEDLVALEELGERAGWGDLDATRPFRDAANREVIERGFGRLSREDREILVLRELEGFTGPEVAEILGMGLNAVKSRLHRARLRFMAALRDDETPTGRS